MRNEWGKIHDATQPDLFGRRDLFLALGLFLLCKPLCLLSQTVSPAQAAADEVVAHLLGLLKGFLLLSLLPPLRRHL